MSKIETGCGNSSEIGVFDRGLSSGGCGRELRVFRFISSIVSGCWFFCAAS